MTIVRIAIGGLAITLMAYMSVEQLMLSRVRTQLKQRHGNDYAILALHMGGEPAEVPRLWHMLSLARQYRFSNEYKPQGSGGFTGKRNYLVILVTDKTSVRAYNWSFRQFSLDNHTSVTPIEQIVEGKRELYEFNPDDRLKRRGCWFAGTRFNNPDIRFYSLRPSFPEA